MKVPDPDEPSVMQLLDVHSIVKPLDTQLVTSPWRHVTAHVIEIPSCASVSDPGRADDGATEHKTPRVSASVPEE